MGAIPPANFISDQPSAEDLEDLEDLEGLADLEDLEDLGPRGSMSLGGWARAAPALFVLLWSTGFIAAKLGAPYAEPFTFLSLRFILVLLLMAPLAWLLRARWPASLREVGHIAAAGVLIQGGYLAGCFAAVYHGMAAGWVALIVGMQPVLTAVAASPFLGERVTPVQWVGLSLGFLGVAMVMWPRSELQALQPISVIWAITALLSMSAGTLYQKRFCPSFDLRSGSVIQFSAALLVLLPLAFLTETMQVRWSAEFIFALAWVVLVLSIGAISLLFHLIAHGEATRVASLFYLIPLITAVMAYLMFGETMTQMAMAGLAVGIVGVALVMRKPGLPVPEA